MVFCHGIHDGARFAIDPRLLRVVLRRNGELKVLEQGHDEDQQFEYSKVTHFVS